MMTARGISEMAKADTRVLLDLSPEEARTLRCLLLEEAWPESEEDAGVLNDIFDALDRTAGAFPTDAT